MEHKIRAAHVKDAPQEHIIVADPAARAALAKMYGLPAIALLRGEFVLQHERAGVIAATLRMQARVTQTCVVTLEPFDDYLDERVALRFVPQSSSPEPEDIELDPETLEGPDEIPYANGEIDLWDALTEQLSLSLDPYPRKPGAELPEEASGAVPNPFAVLKFRKGDQT